MKTQLSLPHRKFVNRLLSGVSAKDAYLHAFPDAQPSTARSGGPRLRNRSHIQAELAALRQKAESLPNTDFLTYVESRRFYARVVRAQAATLPNDSDLWNVRKSSKGIIYLRFPDKLRALTFDAKLAGYDRPKRGADPAGELSQLSQLLARLRQNTLTPVVASSNSTDRSTPLVAEITRPNVLQACRTLFVLIAFVFFMTIARAEEPAYDFILRHGRIIDGTGNPAYHADLAVKDGRIAAIGQITATAKQEFDATNLVIAPGFIDVHTHAEDVDDQPLAENFVRMGVTTLVLGNCGASELNLGVFFHHLEERTFSPNVASLIGHGTIRRRAMHGSFDRVPTPEELEQMKALVRQAMEDGAVGMSTGLIYLPGAFAKTEEIIECAKVAAEFGGLYATHQRSESREIFQSLDEIFRIAREAHIRVEISHLKLSGPGNWGKTDQVLAAIEKARAEGLDVTQDEYVYTASSTGISQLVPESMREGGGAKFLERLHDPAVKAKFVEQMKETLSKRPGTDYAYAVIASYKHEPALNGLNVVEAAKKVRGADALDDQIETILDIETHGGATAVFHGMCEPDLEAFMRHPNTMFASDSGVRKFQVDVPHPRGYGNNARVLGVYVREKHVLRLEDAVRKMTSLPATTFRLAERGELHPGYWADLAVFNPETVADHATFADPHHYSTGFRYVFVNGVLVVNDDKHTEARPGKILRHVVPKAETAAPTGEVGGK